MKKFSIVKNFIYFFFLAITLLIGALWAFFSNLRLSIEFTGGIKMTIA